MMNSNAIRKLLSVIGVLVLIAAMALNFTGCGSNSTPDAPPADTAETTPATDATQAETQGETQTEAEGATFQLIVTDLEGNETPMTIVSTREFVGEALLDEGIITGEMGPYGMYIKTVNGILADYDADQTYWAFYVDGEYALAGVDTTPIDPNCVYSLVLTKG